MWRFSRNDCVPEIWRENKRKSLRERSMANARTFAGASDHRACAYVGDYRLPVHARYLDEQAVFEFLLSQC